MQYGETGLKYGYVQYGETGLHYCSGQYGETGLHYSSEQYGDTGLNYGCISILFICLSYILSCFSIHLLGVFL